MRWLLLVACAGCDVVFHLDTIARPPDAPADVAGDAGCTSFGPWSSPHIISASAAGISDEEPALSPDGTMLVFQRQTPEGTYDLYAATRTGDDFTTVTPIGALDTVQNEQDAFWDPDGTTLYFTRTTTGFPGTAIMAARYAPGAFAAPTATMDYASFQYLERPSISPSHLELAYYNDAVANLYVATRLSPTARWTPATMPLSISSTVADFDPVFADAGNSLYFISRRDPGPFGANPQNHRFLWRATRTRPEDPFADPQGVEIGGVAEPAGPSLSADGRTLVFSGYPDAQEDLYIMTRSCQ